jgi:uncharacterized protein (TIGR03790 family)
MRNEITLQSTLSKNATRQLCRVSIALGATAMSLACGSSSPDPDSSDVVATTADALTRPARRTVDEVLVVYNKNSPISTAVGQDYAQKRGASNVLTVSCADSAVSIDNETISFSKYKTAIAAPISAYLNSHPKIDFIVLAKGIPIRIDGATTGCCENDDDGTNKPSLDSYLAAIDYPSRTDTVKIGITGSGTVGHGYLNRYWKAREPFSHAKFGGYLVTRLDGLTEADAKALVTHALAAEKTRPTGKVLLDIQPDPWGFTSKSAQPSDVTGTVTQESDSGDFNADMLHAHDLLEASGVANELNLTDTFVGNRTGLGGYFSWGSNAVGAFTDSAYDSLFFAPGSIGTTAVSTSGRSFLMPSPPADGGQSLLSELISHGLTGGAAWVGEPLLQAVPAPTYLVNRYFSGYSLAESFYAASRFVGWEAVVIGDPLCTPFATGPVMLAPIAATAFSSASSQIQTEDCTEGDQDVGLVDNGMFTTYHAQKLSNAATFEARVASGGPGGTIEVHLGSPTGKKLGVCTVPVTGDFQKWTTVHCNVSAASGTQDISLVYKGSGASLFSIEWFSFK